MDTAAVDVQVGEEFARNFIKILQKDNLPFNDLKIILTELQVYVANYDIYEKCTAIVPYDWSATQCFSDFLLCKKMEGLSDGTLSAYKLLLQEFFNTVKKFPQDITTNDIRLFLYNRQKNRGVGNRTLDGNRLILSSFFKWCQNEEYIGVNPCAKIAPIKYEIKEREPLTDIELEMVREACETKREKALVETLYSTGCRVSELTILKKSDINWQTKEVHLFGKGNKHRISYMNARMEVTLKGYLKEREDNNEYLFVSMIEPHNALHKSGVEKIVKQIGERSGIGRRLYPHLLRHTMATNALSRGMDITEVQRMLGHEKADTTLIYAKICQDNIKYQHSKCII